MGTLYFLPIWMRSIGDPILSYNTSHIDRSMGTPILLIHMDEKYRRPYTSYYMDEKYGDSYTSYLYG